MIYCENVLPVFKSTSCQLQGYGPHGIYCAKKKKIIVVYLKFKFNWEPCVYFLIFINWPCHRACGILVP